MTAPEPVAAESDRSLLGGDDGNVRSGRVGVPQRCRVLATSNDIVEGQVGLLASSLGGSSLIDDDDAVDALYAADVVTTSGVGDFNQTELESILSDRDTSLGAWITPYTENFAGGAATSDLEMLFQQIHLYMTAPRFDPVALTQMQRSYQPVIDDPRIGSRGRRQRRPARQPIRRRSRGTPRCRRPSSSPHSTWSVSNGCGAIASATAATGCSRSPVTSTSTSCASSPPPTSARCRARPAEQYVDLGTPPPAGIVK